VLRLNGDRFGKIIDENRQDFTDLLSAHKLFDAWAGKEGASDHSWVRLLKIGDRYRVDAGYSSRLAERNQRFTPRSPVQGGLPSINRRRR
jgi:hypothetical protein